MATRDVSNPSYKTLYSIVLRRQCYAEKFSAALTSLCAESEDLVETLGRARRCLAVGTGTGRNELEFVERTMPRLEALVAVEPDGESADDMRVEVARRLPAVETVVRECKLEDWEGEAQVTVRLRYTGIGDKA